MEDPGKGRRIEHTPLPRGSGSNHRSTDRDNRGLVSVQMSQRRVNKR